MTLLAGLTSFMIGNAYHAQMPGFAGDLGHGDPGVSYSVLLAADAAGALLAGIALEAWGRLKPSPGPPSCSPFCGACRCSRSRPSAFTRSRSRCCLPPASSSCRSTRWRRPWCRSMRPPTSAAASSACSTWQASACAPSAASPWASLGAAIGIHWSLGAVGRRAVGVSVRPVSPRDKARLKRRDPHRAVDGLPVLTANCAAKARL